MNSKLQVKFRAIFSYTEPATRWMAYEEMVVQIWLNPGYKWQYLVDRLDRHGLATGLKTNI